jgi:DnaJ-class molecular chaperone
MTEEIQPRIVRRMKSYYTTKCLFGWCKDCTTVKDGIGYHEVKVYDVFKTTASFKCEECDGDGTIEETCSHCEGLGVVDEPCETCNGKGKMADEDDDLEFVKTETELVKR